MNKRFKSVIVLFFFILAASANASVAVERARAALAKSDLDAATAILKDEIKKRPRDARARYIYSKVLNARHDYQGAVREIDEAIRLDRMMKFSTPSRVTRYRNKLVSLSAKDAVVGSVVPSVPIVYPIASPISVDEVTLSSAVINKGSHGGWANENKLALICAGVVSLFLFLAVVWKRLVFRISRRKRKEVIVTHSPKVLANRAEIIRSTIDISDESRISEIGKIDQLLSVIARKVERYPGHVLSEPDQRVLYDISVRLDQMLKPTSPSHRSDLLRLTTVFNALWGSFLQRARKIGALHIRKSADQVSKREPQFFARDDNHA